MKALASCSAPSASSHTLALCRYLLPRTRRVGPPLFTVAPPGPTHDRRRRLPPTSPWTTAFPPLISLDHSP